MRAVDFLQANGKFDSAVLEKVIKETIEEYGFGIAGDLKPEDILLEDSKSPCKVYVQLSFDLPQLKLDQTFNINIHFH